MSLPFVGCLPFNDGEGEEQQMRSSTGVIEGDLHTARMELLGTRALSSGVVVLSYRPAA